MPSSIFRLPVGLSLVALACSSGATAPAPNEVPLPGPGAVPDSLTAFTEVRVVPMDREEVLEGYTVLVRKGRIAEVAPSDRITVPGAAAVVEGRGRYLMPGLVDAHVHMSPDEAPLYVSHGITTVRNMWGWPGLKTIQQEIASGGLLGPTVYSYSSGLDAPPAYWPYTQIVQSPEAARTVVAEQLAMGWIGIKVYRDLSEGVYLAIVDEARRRGAPVVGHVPARVGTALALAAGQRSLEHLLGYDQAVAGGYGVWGSGFDEGAMADLARQTAGVGAWNCPTLTVLRHQSPGGHQDRVRAVGILHREGAPLLAGSDSGIGVTFPGTGLREELRYLQDAGLSPYEALQAATAGVARFLGMPHEFGVVAPGARADLLLLQHNPLDGVENAAALDGVMLRGLWIPAR